MRVQRYVLSCDGCGTESPRTTVPYFTARVARNRGWIVGVRRRLRKRDYCPACAPFHVRRGTR